MTGPFPIQVPPFSDISYELDFKTSRALGVARISEYRVPAQAVPAVRVYHQGVEEGQASW